MEEKQAVLTSYCELGVGWVGGWVGRTTVLQFPLLGMSVKLNRCAGEEVERRGLLSIMGVQKETSLK